MFGKNSDAVSPASHVHAFVPLSLAHTGDGKPKILVVCLCGAFRHIDGVDETKTKTE